jgi:hypothetical protein
MGIKSGRAMHPADALSDYSLLKSSPTWWMRAFRRYDPIGARFQSIVKGLSAILPQTDTEGSSRDLSTALENGSCFNVVLTRVAIRI